MFGNWLLSASAKTEAAEKAHRKLKKIIGRMKYYNKLLIQELCTDRDICDRFIEFFRTGSEEAIETSRIKDKDCHIKAIRNYSKIFEESRTKLDRASPKSTTSQ